MEQLIRLFCHCGPSRGNVETVTVNYCSAPVVARQQQAVSAERSPVSILITAEQRALSCRNHCLRRQKREPRAYRKRFAFPWELNSYFCPPAVCWSGGADHLHRGSVPLRPQEGLPAGDVHRRGVLHKLSPGTCNGDKSKSFLRRVTLEEAVARPVWISGTDKAAGFPLACWLLHSQGQIWRPAAYTTDILHVWPERFNMPFSIEHISAPVELCLSWEGVGSPCIPTSSQPIKSPRFLSLSDH